MQPLTSGYAGGSLAASERGQAEIFGQELASADTEPGDVPALQRQVGRLTTVSNADKLMALVGGAAGAGPAAAPSDNASKLLSMVAGPAAPAGPPITGDPNADPRDIRMQAKGAASNAADQSRNNGWLSTALRNMPSPMAAGRNAQQGGAPMLSVENFPSMARGIVTGVGGIPGNTEDALVHKLPKALGFEGDTGKLPDGSSTFFPTSEDIGEGLAHLGWKADKSRADVEALGDTIGGIFVLPSAVNAGIVGEGARALKGKLVHMGEGGKAGDTIRGMTESIGQKGVQRADEIVGQTPMPKVPKPSEAPMNSPPVPNRETLLNDLPGQGRTAAATTSGKLEGAITAHSDSLQAEKTIEYQKYLASMAEGVAPVNTGKVRKLIEQRMEKGGTGDTRTAMGKVLNDLNHIEQANMSSTERFQALDEIRRQSGQKAKFGDAPTGYAGISASDGRALNAALGDAMKEAHPPYAEYTKKYHDLSQESEPAAAKFLASVGETEGGGTLMDAALRNPKNVATAIKSMGGDTAAFDKMAAEHLTTKAGRLTTAAAREKFVTDTGPMLENLPGAQKAVAEAVRRGDLTDAMEGLAKKFESEGAATAKASDALNAADFKASKGAHEAAVKRAEDYRNDLQQMQYAPLNTQAGHLSSMVKRMKADKLISEGEADSLYKQVQAAGAAVDKQAALRQLSKYVAYSLTGNYLVSFGGPALFNYAIHK